MQPVVTQSSYDYYDDLKKKKKEVNLPSFLSCDIHKTSSWYQLCYSSYKQSFLPYFVSFIKLIRQKRYLCY